MNSYRAIEDKEPDIHCRWDTNPIYGMERGGKSIEAGSRKWHLLFGMLTLLLSLLILDKEAFSATYYIDGSCGNNGNGLADQCASSPGGAGAYQDPQSCLNAMTAGDTCLIKNGTYVTNNHGATPNEDGGFHFTSSGNSLAWITLKNYPGHFPQLINCVSLATNCDHPTITTNFHGYIDIEGLKIQGSLALEGGSVGSPLAGLIVRNNEITVGWEYTTDGNWAGIFMANWTAPQVDHNYIHDASVESGTNDGSASCIKWYSVDHGIDEYNTCKRWRTPGTQAGGVDDKQAAQNNIHRYNWIETVSACFRINNQLTGFNVTVYGNVCYDSIDAIKILTQIDGVHVYNNTIYSASVCLYGEGTSPYPTGVDFYNNSCYLDKSYSETGNYYNYGAAWFNMADYNRFQSGKLYRPDTSHTYGSLAAYQSGYGKDLHSSETPCTFVNPGTDFHLIGGCVGWGHVGGVSSGAPVDVGAYGLTSCVGWTCGRAVKISAPTGLKVQ